MSYPKALFIVLLAFFVVWVVVKYQEFDENCDGQVVKGYTWNQPVCMKESK